MIFGRRRGELGRKDRESVSRRFRDGADLLAAAWLRPDRRRRSRIVRYITDALLVPAAAGATEVNVGGTVSVHGDKISGIDLRDKSLERYPAVSRAHP